MITRTKTKTINVGGVIIGGNNHVVIQSMTNTKTKDIDATIKQINRLANAGCEIIRVACLDIEDAKAIEKIKNNINIPIVADIHFDYKIALAAIESGVDKIRINPGNIGSIDKIKAVVDQCKKHSIPIRIGINGGSLEKDILKEYKNNNKITNPICEAMLASAKRHIEILEQLDFYDICLSLKCTDLETFIEVNQKASGLFEYPIHLGLTESGTAFSGTIKSSIGLSALLRQQIGNTIRVSLSDDPIEEIFVAKEILKNHKLYKAASLIACPTCGRIQYDLFSVTKQIEPFLQNINEDITVAIMGCAVNGPGEAMEADIGIAGGINEGLLFKKGQIIRKVKQEEMVEVLKDEIMLLVNEKRCQI